MEIIYKKDGIIVGENFISLVEITEKCNIEKLKEEKLILLKMEWKGWRGFEEGILVKIVLPIEKIEIIKKFMLGKEINFGEIAGKHSEIYNSFDENDIELIYDQKEICDFLLNNPSGHEYNHSFLYTFHDHVLDGIYDDVTEEDVEWIQTIFGNE